MTELHIRVLPASCLDGMDSVPAPAGVSVQIAEVSKYAIGWDDCLIAILAIAGDVTSRVIAAWIYDTLFVNPKKQPKKIRIGKADIDLQKQDVVRAMEDAINAQHRNGDDR